MIDLTIDKADYDLLMKEGSLKMCRPAKRVNGFKRGCGIQAGQYRNIRWIAPPQQNEKKAKPRGGMTVQALSVAYCETDDQWEITFIRQIEEAPEYLLAVGAGYTQNADASCDPEAPVPYSPDVERIVADQQAAQREARKARLARIAREAEDMTDTETERKAKVKIEQAILAALSDLDLEEAA